MAWHRIHEHCSAVLVTDPTVRPLPAGVGGASSPGVGGAGMAENGCGGDGGGDDAFVVSPGGSVGCADGAGDGGAAGEARKMAVTSSEQEDNAIMRVSELS